MQYAIRCEVGGIQEIDGMRYIGVTGPNEVMGVSGKNILSNAKRNEQVWEQCKTGRQNSGYPITLVPVSFVEGLKVEYTSESGEIQMIDGVRYVGVTRPNEVMGVRGFTILSNAKKDEKVWKECREGRQNSGHSITLVPVSFVEGLNVEYTSEPGEIQGIDGVKYVGVTQSTKYMGMTGQTILKNSKKNEKVWVLCKEGRQKNGRNITLVPVGFVEGLKVEYTCGLGETQEIDNVKYVGVTQLNEVMGVKGFTILSNTKKHKEVWEQCKEGRQKNGMNITLVPVSFVEGLAQKNKK